MINKLSGIAVVIFGVLLLTFLLIHLVPGDPVEVMLGESATQVDRLQLRTELGLDQPLIQQFATYITKISQGDFGQSIHSKTSITILIKTRYPATL